MFDGEQFHQFISTPSTRIIPSNSTNTLIQTPPIQSNFLSFDPLLFPPPIPTHHQTLFQSNHFVRTPPTREQFNGSHQGKVDQQEIDINDSWSNDEVIHLLRIKSSSENWFRDFTWDHVSRKLAEMGYKRSAEKCEEKFEEETCRSFGNTIAYNNKNNNRYLISEELDEHIYNNNADQNTHHHVTIHESPNENVIHQEQEIHEKGGEQNIDTEGQKGQFEKDPSEITMVQPTEDEVVQVTNRKKRKRKHKKFKMVKGLCVDLVQKMMAQQEEMHKKLLEDMVNRDEEKIKRDEAWRKEEMERLKREIHISEQEHEMAKDRQSTITEFLNKITSFDQNIQIPFDMSLKDLENPIPVSDMTKIPLSDNYDQCHSKDDIGKRWPRDEVLALINTRSNVSSGIGISGNNEEHQEYIGNNKGGGGASGSSSLWERISQGMLELGYKRSAKRCKEKWENINKYFRKTKDANKKRSLDSRTCPYYHELSKLYNQERTTIPTSSPSSGGPSTQEPEKSCPTTITPEK